MLVLATGPDFRLVPVPIPVPVPVPVPPGTGRWQLVLPHAKLGPLDMGQFYH